LTVAKSSTAIQNIILTGIYRTTHGLILCNTYAVRTQIK